MAGHIYHFQKLLANLFHYSGEEIRHFCINGTCPEDPRLATVDNCCISHANVHSCQSSATVSAVYANLCYI